MKRTTSAIVVALTAFLLGSNLTAQEPDVPVEAVLLNYLSGYCDEGEQNTFIDFIRENAQIVEPLLLDYVQKGVPEELIDSLETSLIKQYNDRQKLLGQDLQFGLTKEELDSVRNESQEDFSQRSVQEFRDGFISQAIFGLSLIDSEESQVLIKKIAEDESNPYQEAAQNALNRVYLQQK